jgi:hypothetical protein
MSGQSAGRRPVSKAGPAGFESLAVRMILKSETDNPIPGLLLLACSAAIVPGLLVALVVYGRELVKAIREHGWRNFDEED